MTIVIDYNKGQKETTPSRRMWVYPSEKYFLQANSYILSQDPVREVGLAMVVLSEEQKTIIRGGLSKIILITAMSEDRDFLDCYRPEPLYLSVPGNEEGLFEAGVADLKKAEKIEGKYYIPVKIFASK